MKIWEKAVLTAKQAAEELGEPVLSWALEQLRIAVDTGRLQSCFREEEYSSVHTQEAADGFAECMDDESVVPHRPLHTVKHCWEYLMQWLDKFEEVLSQEGEAVTIADEYLPTDSLIGDTNIELVKMLHKGATKEEISEKLQITPRAVQEKIAALNGKRKLPLRVGGQALRVNVSDVRIVPREGEEASEKKSKKNTKEYHTWNTLHPVTLQLNVMQLWTLFRALALYHSKGMELGDDIAKDIWVQLSEYGQDRLKALSKDWMIERLMPLDEDVDLSNYLNKLKSESGNSAHEFHTERELLLASDDNVHCEAYLMFYKAGRECNVKYGIYPNEKILEHQKIVNYANGILSFRDADDRTAPVTEVKESEIERLELCE